MSNSPEFLDKPKTSLSDKWGALQPRERVFLVGGVILLIGMIVFVAFQSVHRNIEKQLTETESYRKALDYIAENQESYHQNKAKKEALTQRLLNADSKIASKLTSMASALEIDVTVNPKDAKKTSDDSGAEEQEFEIVLKNADYHKFMEYLVQIHKLDTPIYIRHLNMIRSSNINNSDTKMTVTITLISYRLKKDPKDSKDSNAT